MAQDSLDMNPGSIETIRDLPDGRFTGKVVDYDVKENANGKKFVQFAFRAEEALEGQDMTGVEPNSRVYSERLYLTTDALKYTKRAISNFGVAEEGHDTLRDWLEAITGADVQFTLKTETNEKTNKSYRNVVSWRANA